MGKFVDDSVRNSGLTTMGTCVRMTLCKAEPVNFADIDTQSLGSVVMSSGDYTLADGEIDGRRSVVGTKNITPTDNDVGATLHIVHDDGSKIMAYTTINPKGIIVSQVEPIPVHSITMRAVTQ